MSESMETLKTNPQPDDAPTLSLSERADVQLPALDMLARLGFQILSREEALALRGGKFTAPLLTDILRAQLPKINRIRYRGEEYPFSPQNIRRAVQTLEDVPLAQGLMHASEETYDLLRLGKSLDQSIAGDMRAFTLRYIDWRNPENNVFHATPEFTLYRAGSKETCRLDIVCFVNGIPFVAIECKARSEELSRAVQDILSYQSADYIPDFFKYVQITLTLKGNEAQYATVGAKADFWAVWKSRPDEATAVDEVIAALLQAELPPLEKEAVVANFVRERPQYYALTESPREVTEQDRALYHLCRPARMLELIERFMIYDGGIKKIARYQQYDAVQNAMRRILTHQSEPRKRDGVIWHTQGSGKSLTMVFLANALALSQEIELPRIVLVTDRRDLDRQIKTTFARCGLDPKQATSGADLRRLVRDTQATLITTLVQKFDNALDAGELADPSANIFVLVDEGHRTQYGPLHAKMRRVFPNACYIGFTGTPLLKKEKSTLNRFGGLIDSYSMDQAVRDKAVAPLLYEARHIEQEVQQNGIDAWFERICRDLSPRQREDLKQKYSRTDRIARSARRLVMTAYDVSEHYRAHWQSDGYYKAQLVAPDKKSALRLHRELQAIGHVTSAVVISPPDEREGEDDPEEDADNIAHFWRDEVMPHGSAEAYEKRMIERFDSPDAPEILIVVDKLLTGFDAPRNTVLYLARRLAHHSLLQAVARVNRLYPGKDFGYIIDYVGILEELDRALCEYRALEGYDEKDLAGMMAPVQTEYHKLPAYHAALLQLFQEIPNAADTEAMEQSLADEERRKIFGNALNDFARCLKLALSTERFYEETDARTIERYRADLTRFQKLRVAVQIRYADTVNIRDYEPGIAKLLDTHISADSVTVLTPGPINIFDAVAMEDTLRLLGSDAARADSIASAMSRTITERMAEDPARFRKFSEMLEEAIAAFRQRMIDAAEYLQRVREMREQFVAGHTPDGLPVPLKDREVAAVFYRTLQENWKEIAVTPQNDAAAVNLALAIEEAIRRETVVDWRDKSDVINQIRANLDDLFFEASQRGEIRMEWTALDRIAAEIIGIAKKRIP